MQKQDGDRLRAPRNGIGQGCAHLGLIELDQHLALGVDALAHLVAQIALDQRRVPPEEQIVRLRPVDAADLVDVAETLRGDERAVRAGALENGVDRDGGAVQEQRRRAKAQAGLAHAGLDPGDQRRRRGQRLAELERAGRLVEGGNIGEGAADIGRQSDPARLEHAQSRAP